MASSSTQPDPAAASTPQDIPQQPSRPGDDLPNPTPVEMSTLESKTTPPEQEGGSRLASLDGSTKPRGPMRTDTTTALEQSAHPPPPPVPAIPDTPLAPASRTFSTAIGPSSDSPIVPSKDAEATGPTLTMTLLLTSGARHPFKLDAKYLSKRNVEVAGSDPFNMSVYKLKELILREWREEWEAKPASPSSIRLISFGKLLDDKAPLKGNNPSRRTVHGTHTDLTRLKVQCRCAQRSTHDDQAPRLH